MTEKLQIYKCSICGNVVQVLHQGVGSLVCCGQGMELLIPKYKDEDNKEMVEKHLPEIEMCGGTKIISLPEHPMFPEHYIRFIEAYSKDRTQLYLKYFYPNERPTVDVSFMDGKIYAIECCTIHGLWGKTND